MATYKLIYFDLKGRAAVARLLFDMAGQKYEESVVQFQDWATLKPTFPFEALPVLEITENSKTHAICRYLANKFGFAGKDEIEKAHCDMIIDQVLDIWNLLLKVYVTPESEEKKTNLSKAMNEQVPHMLKLVQNILEANKTGYFVGDSVTVADVYVVNFYDWLREHKESVLSKLPALKQHEEKIRALPKIAEHLKKHANQRLTILFPN